MTETAAEVFKNNCSYRHPVPERVPYLDVQILDIHGGSIEVNDKLTCRVLVGEQVN